MPVYIIRAGAHGPVKIGYSDNVALRLVKMQADNHERLILLRQFHGGRAEETLLHQRFAANAQHGEWHEFSPAMLGDVGLREIEATLDELLDDCIDIWGRVRKREANAMSEVATAPSAEAAE